jgi:hypothetical protein
MIMEPDQRAAEAWWLNGLTVTHGELFILVLRTNDLLNSAERLHCRHY